MNRPGTLPAPANRYSQVYPCRRNAIPRPTQENHAYTVLLPWYDHQNKNSTRPTFHRSSSGSAPATRSRVVYGVALAPAVSVPVLQNSNTPSPGTPPLHHPISPGLSPRGNPFSAGTALPPRLVAQNNQENHSYTVLSPPYNFTQTLFQQQWTICRSYCRAGMPLEAHTEPALSPSNVSWPQFCRAAMPSPCGMGWVSRRDTARQKTEGKMRDKP
jgi:hypothetical protein